MNNNIISDLNLIDGLNVNPIPLEFANEMTTAKMLYAMQAKLTTMVNFINTWYDNIIVDLENDGILYQKLTENFNNTIKQLNTSIDTINTTLTTLGYIKPTIAVTLSPSQTLYQYGENINSVIINYVITKGSKDITQIKLYKNGVLIQTISSNIVLNSFITDGSIVKDSADYYVEITDGVNVIDSATLSIRFVNDCYYGVCDTGTTITESLIKSFNAVKTVKGDVKCSYSGTTKKLIFAYPTSYGDLSSIKDANDLEIIDSFDNSSVNLTLNGVVVGYTVYELKHDVTINNFIITFKF